MKYDEVECNIYFAMKKCGSAQNDKHTVKMKYIDRNSTESCEELLEGILSWYAEIELQHM